MKKTAQGKARGPSPLKKRGVRSRSHVGQPGLAISSSITRSATKKQYEKSIEAEEDAVVVAAVVVPPHAHLWRSSRRSNAVVLPFRSAFAFDIPDNPDI